MENKKFWKGALCGALVMFALVLAGTGIKKVVGAYLPQLLSGGTEGYSEEKMELIKSIIDKYYLRSEDIDEDALEEGFYAGYVEALNDPYSVYYTEEEAKELLQGISGEYSGVGAVLSQDRNTKAITITRVFKDSPADEAGIQDGDILFQVDDHEITDEDLNTVVSWIKGEEGTEVTLHVIRDTEELQLTAVRRVIESETVSYEMKDGQIGYILITEFDDVTYEQFKTALDDLESQGMTGLVIDLRSNPGGNLDIVVNMLKLILPEGTIVSTEDRNGEREEFTCDGSQEFKKPLAVLVNDYSASASEIFAGAVQDYGIGEIVGTTTYGKGVVQQVISLMDGSYLKLTTSEYFTPSGRSIDGVGIEPDVEIVYEYDEENRNKNI